MRWVGRKILGVDANASPLQLEELRAVGLVEEDIRERLAPPRRVVKPAHVQFSERESAFHEAERVARSGEEENGPLGVHLAPERRIERLRDGDDTAARAFRNREEIEIGPIGIGPEGIGDDGEERGVKGAPPAVGHLTVDQPVVDARQEERHLRG